MSWYCWQVGSSENVQWLRKERGVKKPSGCTWIEGNNEVNSFLVNDQENEDYAQRNPCRTEEIVRRDACHGIICTRYKNCAAWCGGRKDSFIWGTTARKWLLHLVSSAHLLVLCSTFSKVWFSERLASAFGVISTPLGTLLHVLRNLLVSGFIPHRFEPTWQLRWAEVATWMVFRVGYNIGKCQHRSQVCNVGHRSQVHNNVCSTTCLNSTDVGRSWSSLACNVVWNMPEGSPYEGDIVHISAPNSHDICSAIEH